MKQVPSPIDGCWQMTRAENAGEAAPDLVTEQMSLDLAQGAYAVSYSGKVVDSGTYAVDGEAEQGTLMLQGQAGPNAGRTIPCIFQLRGDRLRICYGFDGVPPTDYSTNPVNQRYLGVYRRG